MKKQLRKRQRRRVLRVRRRLHGRPDCPRLAVHRSLKNIQCQLIDDEAGRTLASASTLEKEIRGQRPKGGDVDAAREVGRLIGRRAQSQGIQRVVFDRHGYRYHGRVKALADGAREAGLKF